MLLTLHIENLAIIKSTTIEFKDGFNVLTGETGAGKSLIMRALKMLTGAKVSKDDIRKGDDFALAEGCFSDVNDDILASIDITADDDGMVFISRKITQDGKNSCKINDRPVPLSKLKAVTSLLMDIHGQNDTRIIDEKAQLSIIDEFAKINLESYSNAFKNYTEAKSKLEEAVSNESNKELKLDMINYQLSELTKHNFKNGEEAQLLERSKILKNSEKINNAVNITLECLRNGSKNASDAVYDALYALRSVEGIIDEASDLIGRLESVKYEIDDIADTTEGFGDNAAQSEYELDRIESRLHTISALKRKYSKSYEELLVFIDELKEEREVLMDSENNITKLKKRCADFKKTVLEEGKRITEQRKNASITLAESVKNHLEGLGMKAFRFKIEFIEKEPSSDGTDKIEFLISANAGEEFKSLEKTASGGELSRFMLALKSAFSETDDVSTMVFDEIDTGISGQTSEMLGIKLKSLSKKNKQVICVTHSAQIASLAKHHFFVRKSEKDGRTTSTVTLLSEKERIEEISRIMGGIEISQNVYSAAAEMLKKGAKS